MTIKEAYKLLETKNKARTIFLFLLFVILLIWIIIYQFIFMKFPAPHIFLYDLGVIINSLSSAYVTGFIFYLLTVILPQRHLEKNLQQNILLMKSNLSKQLTNLMNLLINNKEWHEFSDAQLSKHFLNMEKTRRIWIEESNYLLFNIDFLPIYKPTTLNLLSFTLTKVQATMKEIIEYGEYFEHDYLEKIVWLKNSYAFTNISKLLINDNNYLDIDLNEEKYTLGNTYLDAFFNKELSLIIRTPVGSDRVLLEEIKILISYNKN